VLEALRTDESLQIDEILELLETQLTSSEVFTALFELEITAACAACRGRTTYAQCDGFLIYRLNYSAFHTSENSIRRQLSSFLRDLLTTKGYLHTRYYESK